MARMTRSRSDLASLPPAEVGQKRKRGTTSSSRSELKRRRSSPVLESDQAEPEASDEDAELDQEEAELDSCMSFHSLPSVVTPLRIPRISADEFLLHQAPKWQLNRLRKEDLSRLYALAGLDQQYDDEHDLLKKSTLLTRIMAARPSSSASRHHVLPDHSSNDGGSEEETDIEAVAPSPKRAKVLRRRTTENIGLGHVSATTTRSASMHNLSKYAEKRGKQSGNAVNTRNLRFVLYVFLTVSSSLKVLIDAAVIERRAHRLAPHLRMSYLSLHPPAKLALKPQGKGKERGRGSRSKSNSVLRTLTPSPLLMKPTTMMGLRQSLLSMRDLVVLSRQHPSVL